MPPRTSPPDPIQWDFGSAQEDLNVDGVTPRVTIRSTQDAYQRAINRLSSYTLRPNTPTATPTTFDISRYTSDWSTIPTPEPATERIAVPPRRRLVQTQSVPDTTEEEFTKSDNCPCASCQITKGEIGLTPTEIRHYSYEPPGGWVEFRTRNDLSTYALGVELETTNKDGLVSGEIVSSLRRPQEFWVPKADSSVTGPELVSYPATLSWWREHEADLREMFQNLLHAGFRSHDGGAAGMHVNISRAAFDNWRHLYRFMVLLHADPQWTLRMSQRTKNSLDYFSNLTWRERPRLGIARDYVGSTALKMGDRAVAVYASSKFNVPMAHGRHTAFNVPGDGRYEFRVPRGSLRIDRFFKNLEWTVGMIEFTRKCHATYARPKKFMEYVRNNRDKYPYLANFLDEKISDYHQPKIVPQERPQFRQWSYDQWRTFQAGEQFTYNGYLWTQPDLSSLTHLCLPDEDVCHDCQRVYGRVRFQPQV